jgi:hypothetical protein
MDASQDDNDNNDDDNNKNNKSMKMMTTLTAKRHVVISNKQKRLSAMGIVGIGTPIYCPL